MSKNVDNRSLPSQQISCPMLAENCLFTETSSPFGAPRISYPREVLVSRLILSMVTGVDNSILKATPLLGNDEGKDRQAIIDGDCYLHSKHHGLCIVHFFRQE